jgi:tetratricopeptide (TPR) repeat protein
MASDPRTELKSLQSKLATVQDPIILGVLKERIEALKASIPAEELPSLEIPEAAAAPEIPESTEPPTPEQAQEAERIIRLWRVEKMRGHRPEADALLQQAMAVAPTSAIVLEIVGDDAMERRNLQKARLAYERAAKLDPNNVGLERKFARLVMNQSPGLTIEEQLRLGYADSALLAPTDSIADLRVARILNVFLPGLGQIVLGQTRKGLIFLVLWLACVMAIVILRADLQELLRTLAGRPGRPTMIVLVPIFGVFITTIASLAGLSGAGGSSRKHVDRPRPPVNLPFE